MNRTGPKLKGRRWPPENTSPPEAILDLYKYFCQRYRTLVRSNGSIGVVLPRTAFVNKGSEGFREWVYTQTTARRIDFLRNTGRWMFSAEPRYGIALISAKNYPPDDTHKVELAATAYSNESWAQQSGSPGILLDRSLFGFGWMTPQLRSQDEADLLAKLRVGSPFPLGSAGTQESAHTQASEGRWQCFPVAELHETNHKHLWSDASGGWPLWKGESFDQYNPHGAGARQCPTNDPVWKKLRKSRPGSTSMLAESTQLKHRVQAVSAELGRARVAFRGIGRLDDNRTVIACLIPPPGVVDQFIAVRGFHRR